MNRRVVFLLIIGIEVIALIAISGFVLNSKTNPVSLQTQAQVDDLTVVIDRDQYYYIDDTMKTNGYLYWAELSGGNLILYGNTSDMFEIAFWDQMGNLTETTDYTMYDDRIEIRVRTTELNYEIRSNYYPDYFLDTNFIVIFDTFWAQFSYLTPENEERYAPINYHNKQIIPEGAGLVSYAPTDGAIIVKEGDSFGIVWEYQEKPMDPFHEPLTYEITYNFDPIYLQFTEQMFQNQQQQQEREQIDNLLDLLQVYFRIITFFAIILSLIAALYGYLRAKRKFKSKLNEARSMPKKMLKDIEAETESSKRVSAMFSAFILILIVSPIFHTNAKNIVNFSVAVNDRKVMLEGIGFQADPSRNIQYSAIIDLGRDGIAVEEIIMDMPYSVDNFSIWANTAEVLDFRAYNDLGAPVSFQEFSDHYLIRNVQGYIRYEIIRPYIYHNNSNILVYLDMFWLLFLDPELEEYSRADIKYTVIIPDGAILYSASPENILTLSQTPEGRRKVIFDDYNREIDPYHDLFSTQVTFSYIDVIDAIENQSARFEHFRVETEISKEQQASLTRNLIFISLLGLIAPLLAFLLTYFIVRRRMLRKIQEEEQKYEMLISVEETQIRAMKEALNIDLAKEPWKAMIGEYWELLAYLSRLTPVNLLAMNEDLHENIIRKYVSSFLITETLELISTGRTLAQNWLNNEQIYYNRQQARDYLESIIKLIEKLEKWRKEQK
ncbi:MAG: hypothetical protein H7645_02140 [Candidatus Heimdallarchaeota archaeon]|nr:hypothetical protein [Candidatus Heimdallarchaeota archaeon]MCK4769118.1 hypothetical protein [Candidatus Heimdallarchaeota archaeon]